MLRTLITVGVLLVAVHLQAQKADIYIDTLHQDKYQDVIVDFGLTKMFGQKYTYKYKTVEKIIFYEKPYPSFIQKLRDQQIEIVYGFEDISLDNLTDKEKEQVDLRLYELHRAYRNQDAGVILQVVGAGALATATILTVTDMPGNSSLKDVVKRQNLIKTLAVGGGLSFTAGIVIHLNGNRMMFRTAHPDL